jgi:hypothetical protein
MNITRTVQRQHLFDQIKRITHIYNTSCGTVAYFWQLRISPFCELAQFRPPTEVGTFG